jgi:hypothetical protein
MPTRLTVIGSKIQLGSAPFVPIGVSVSVRTYQPGDVAIIAAMGANMVRVVVPWYNSVPQTAGDAYAPASPGSFDPGKLATIQAVVAEAQSVGLWVDIAISGCGADFWTNATVQAQHVVMWQFLAATFAGSAFIMAYELLSEPHPMPNNPALVSTVYSQAITAALTADAATPFIVGPGVTYDVRYISQALLGFSNLIYTFNWYEPTLYNQQSQGGGPNNWDSYPGSYLDKKGQPTDCPASYPGRGAVDLINQQWLAGLLGVGAAFSAANSVPVWCNQIGIVSATPDSQSWFGDCLDNFNAIGVGYCVWVLRVPYNTGSIGDPFGSTNSYGDIGLYGQDMNSGDWLPNSGLVALLSSKFKTAQNVVAPTGGLAVGAAGSGLVTLSNLPNLPAPTGSDIVPILRTPLQLQNATMGAVQAFVVNSVKAFGAMGDGITDDTGPIQGAINSGAPFYFPAGVYSISSTLAFNSANAHGQVVRGSGPTASDGTGVGKAVIRPLAGVSVAIQIDGTPFGGYVQGFGLEDLTIDMVNMADVATSVAVQQVQAFGGRFVNVKVYNSGENKRAWQFLTGAYTTSLHNCKGNIVECIGNSTANGVTTLSFYDFDGGQMSTIYTNSITVIGGAWQGVASTKFKFRFGTDFWLKTDVEGGGVFLDVDASVNALRTYCELQGFSGVYMNGAPAASSQLFDQQVNYNTYPFNMTVGKFQLNNQGVSGNSSLLSGVAGANYYLEIGRTSLDLLLGVAGASNDFVPGTSSGDAVLGAWSSGSTLFLAGGSIPMAKVTSSGFTTFGSGTLHCGVFAQTPASDGADLFIIKNAGGTALLDVTTNMAPALSVFGFGNGVSQIGYSDNFGTQTWRLNAASGQFNCQTVNIKPAADASSVFTAANLAGSVIFGVNTATTGAASAVQVSNSAPLQGYSDGASTLQWSLNSANGIIKQFPHACASLPVATGTAIGSRTLITDCSLVAAGNYGAVAVGGGTNVVPVYSDGTNWRIG